jgi:digeranylgeranylglycerophospholipid reductase
VIIGADGPHSTVGRWMGRRPPRLIPGIQVRVPLAVSMSHTEVHFHPRIFGAYGWVFPRGDEANVGLALAGGEGFPRSLRPMLDWFVGRIAEEGKIEARSRGLTFGWIPVKPQERTLNHNMLLAGDAAGHTHPITGAGIANAMLAGRLAAEWAVEAVRKGDAGVLQGYDEAIKAELGETLSRGSRRRQLLEAQWERLSEVLPRCWTGFKAYYRDDQNGAGR